MALGNCKNVGMSYDPDKHHRKSIQRKHYDYSQAGFYFVTVVTQHRQHVFGEVQNGVMIKNAAGEMVENIWYDLPERFPQVELDAFVVMPNHIHGIIVINNHQTMTTQNDNVGVGLVPTLTRTANQPPLDETQHTNDKTALTPNAPVGAGLVPAPAPATHQPPLDKTKRMNDESGFASNDTVRAPTRGAPTRTNIGTSSIANEKDTRNDTKTMLTPNENANTVKRPPLGDVVGIFKSLTTHAYVMGIREHDWPPFDKRLWQRNFYERILRTDDALSKARAYIHANPHNWEKDANNP